jgi:hypothetical protein
MRGRQKTGGRSVKTRRRKKSLRRNATKARHRSSSAARQETNVAPLIRELKDAREHQRATEEILASITGSFTDAKPVFDAIVRNLQRFFGTRRAIVQLLKEGMVHLAAAAHEVEFETLSKQFPGVLDESTGSGRAIISKKVLQYVPVLGNPAVPPATQRFARELGFNSVIYAPMVRGDTVIGAIATARREAKPFDNKSRSHQSLRRSSGDRNRKCAAVHGGKRSTGAADRNLGGAASHLQFAWRAWSGLRDHSGECNTHL